MPEPRNRCRKVISEKKYLSASAGVLLTHYFNFSQEYFIPDNNPSYPVLESVHKENRFDLFSFGADGFAKLLLPVKKLNIGTVIILPLYTVWRTDAIFPDETNNNTRSKWMQGVGIGISAGYAIK